MLKRLFIIANLLILSACDPFEGIISVKQQFIVKSSEKSSGCNGDQNFGCDQIVNVTVPVGDVSAKLEFPSKTQIQIDLKINGKKKQLNLELPKKLNVPDSGDFAITAKDLGQDFGAQGKSDKLVTDSELQKGYQQCTYQRPETVCYIVNNSQVCRIEYRTVYGQQYVEYFDRNTNQKLNVDFVSAQNSVLASFNGERNSSERIYRYQAQCF